MWNVLFTKINKWNERVELLKSQHKVLDIHNRSMSKWQIFSRPVTENYKRYQTCTLQIHRKAPKRAVSMQECQTWHLSTSMGGKNGDEQHDNQHWRHKQGLHATFTIRKHLKIPFTFDSKHQGGSQFVFFTHFLLILNLPRVISELIRNHIYSPAVNHSTLSTVKCLLSWTNILNHSRYKDKNNYLLAETFLFF